MIPASYLFKDVFHQSFYDPDITDAIQRHRNSRGPGPLSRLRRHHQQTSSALSALGANGPANEG